ncbi:PREDICTED: uncharacterized protein LOC109169444 [Ipomoea nil]|uniref:uncharacterized protein LOC109169444 n=1 Tax=Ipomoea nil TaxID=35883 RepID=UPI000901BDFC|nr:PREDICTED: uncharacterized protein LOC109169444 [Ipomoea nil]
MASTTGTPSDEATSTTANPAHGQWIQQDQSILSLLISSLSEEVMYLAVGKTTSRDFWTLIETALASSTRARCLNLLGRLQALRQGDSTPAEYIGKTQLLVEDLAQAGRPISLDEQNLYVFRGLRPEFRAMAGSLAITGTPVSLPQLSDYLQTQEFIHANDYLTGGSLAPGGATAMVANHGRRNNTDHGGRHNRGGNRGGQRGRGAPGRGRGGGTPRCQICGSHGHTAVYCFRRYSDQPPPPQAHVAVNGDAAATEVSAWYPDTGVSSHATPDAGMLAQSDDYSGSDVLRVGNGTVDNNVFFEFHPKVFVVKDCITKAVLLKSPASGGLYTLTIPRCQQAFIQATVSSWLAEESFADDTGGFNISINAPGDATALAPAQATPRLGDALVKAFLSHSL